MGGFAVRGLCVARFGQLRGGSLAPLLLLCVTHFARFFARLLLLSIIRFAQFNYLVEQESPGPGVTQAPAYRYLTLRLNSARRVRRCGNRRPNRRHRTEAYPGPH